MVLGKLNVPKLKNKPGPPLTTLPKINLKSSKGLNVRPQTVKFLEGSTEKMLLDVGLDDDFFGYGTKSRGSKTKTSKWDRVELQGVCMVKKAIINMKEQPTEQEENCKPRI